jgi:tetratricopeptide (TPR) repeat protein
LTDRQTTCIKATAVIVAALTFQTAGYGQSPEASDPLLGQGLNLMRSGDFEGAAATLRKAVQSSPASATAHYNLALALLRLEKNSEAADELKKVTMLAPQLAPAHYNLAVLLERSGDLNQAIEQLQAFRTLNPGDPAALIHLVGDYFKTENSTQALALAREALSQFSDLRVKAQLGLLLVQNGHSVEALEPLETVVRSAPEAVGVMPVLARAYLETGHPQQALTVLHEAAKLKLDGAESYYGSLGKWLLEKRRLADASAVLKQGIEQVPTSVNLNLMLGVAEADLHGTAAARPYIEKALKIDPQAALGYNLLGNLFLRLGSYEDAARSYQHATELAPTNDLYWYDVALALERMNKLTEAIPYAEKAVQLKPERGIAHYMLGKLYAKLNRSTEAIGELETCIRLEPQADSSYYLLARTYRKLGNESKAEEWSSKLTKRKAMRDQQVGLMGPASESTSLLDPPAPWDKLP